MALGSDLDIEVRTTGDDTNGGCFRRAAATTDYSNQDSAELSLTDLATSGAGSTTLTSSTGGFTSEMVDNCINISSGTNFTTGLYRVTGHTDTNTVTLDRTPTPSGAGSSGNGKLGGAFATPGYAFSFLGTGTDEINGGWVLHIKEGTYTITTAVSGSNGPMSNTQSQDGVIIGYKTTRKDMDITGRPVIQASGISNLELLRFDSDEASFVANLELDGNNETNMIGLQDAGNRSLWVYQCKFSNCTNAGASHSVSSFPVLVNCEANACGIGFRNTQNYHCLARDCTTGFELDRSWINMNIRCIAHNSTNNGFLVTDSGSVEQVAYFINCTSEGNGSAGFKDGCTTGGSVIYINCVADNNGTYGYDATTASNKLAFFANCAANENTSGDRTSEYKHVDIGFIDTNTITQSLWEDVANDNFEPNELSNGGGLLRGGGIKIPNQDASNNIGAVQHITVLPKKVVNTKRIR
jgi:hypothetical protein